MTNTLPASRYDGHKTLPWHDDEMVVVNGHKLVYTMDDGAMRVRFPGGGSEYVEVLRQRGADITMPKVIRQRVMVDGGRRAL